MTKALGKDIWNFYINGWPSGFYHDEFEIEIGYIPGEDSLDKAYPLIDLDKEYKLEDFGLVVPENKADHNNNISFEDAYLSWKGIKKPEPMTFNEWFENTYPYGNAVEIMGTTGHRLYAFKRAMRSAWRAGIESVKGETNNAI